MRKTKKILGLAAALLATTSLVGCDIVTKGEKENIIFTYTGANGNKINYTAEDLFKNYEGNKTSSKTMFDAVYKVAVENYFKADNPSEELKSLNNRIERDATNDLEQAKQDAQNSANTNKTTYNEEFIKILSTNHVHDENELKEYYIYEHRKTEFLELSYEKNLEVLKDGANEGKIKIGDIQTDEKFSGSYIKDKFPYHVRHILVKIDNTSSNPFRERISEAAAKKLFDVVNALGKGDESFGQIAKDNSDDEGSAKNYGDLGIMDKDTSFVDEFKLGLYAYDALFSQEYKDKTDVEEKINIPGHSPDNPGKAFDILNGDFGKVKYDGTNTTDTGKFLNQITLESIEKLNSVANIEKDKWGSPVLDGVEDLFPRNIIFNNEINKKTICFITRATNTTGRKTSGDGKCGWLLPENVKGIDSTNWSGKDILTDENDYPILAFKSQTGSVETPTEDSENSEESSSSTGYKGIHLVSIVRNGFTRLLPDYTSYVKDEDYWTYYYPGQNEYPKKADGKDQRTFVNYINGETKDYKSKADDLKSKVKNVEKNFEYKIYEALVQKNIFTFKENDTAKAVKNNIENLITINRNETNITEEKDWDDKWNKWADTLKNEFDFRALTTGSSPSEPKYLVSETCAKYFTDNAGQGPDGKKWFDSDNFKSGGLCYVKK